MNTRLTCEATRGQFVRFLEGDLEPKSADRLKVHLCDCPSCRQAFFRTAAQGISEAQTAMRAGVRGTPWTFLRTLAARGEVWAREELKHAQDALRRAVFLLPSLSNRAGLSGATLGRTVSAWPESVRLEIVNRAGERQRRQVVLRVVQPATVSTTRSFSLVLRGDDVKLAGCKLLCTVVAGEGCKVTFEKDFGRRRSGSDFQAKIKADGLPRVRRKVLYPYEHVKLFVQEREPDAV